MDESVGVSTEEIPSKRQKISKKSNEPNPLISKTEKCKVCDEPAAIHIHYGAITCFSCRAFFRRSIQNHSSEAYRCRKDSNCNISLKSRKSCQKCRFEKCIRIGMKSNWVLTDEERIHRFRKQREKHHDQQTQQGPFCGVQHLEQEVIQSCYQSSPEQDEDDDEASPASSRSYGDGEFDQPHYYPFNSRQTSPNHSLSSSNSPPNFTNQLIVKSELDCDPLPMFGALAMDFSNKTDATQRLETVKSITFPMKSQLDDSLLPMHLGQTMNPSEPLNLKVNMSYSSKQQESPRQAGRFFEDPRHDERMQQDVPAEHPKRDVALVGYMPKVSIDEFSQIQSISRIHDANYKSISFGEELIKEMVMSSVFKVPLSPNATMTAYRLMIQRVTRVAQGLDSFVSLPYKVQSMLLKQNADLIVSLRGAVFFEKRKGGLDQILISMGVDDLGAAMNMVTSAVKTKNLQRIDYSTFNSLQKVSNNETEKRYNELLEHVGVTVSFDMDLVKILSYILLFTVNPDESECPELRDVVHMREQMIGMMQRYIFAKYPEETASKLLSGVLRCIANLQELTWIKKQRQLAPSHATKVSEDCAMLTDPKKSLHFNP